MRYLLDVAFGVSFLGVTYHNLSIFWLIRIFLWDATCHVSRIPSITWIVEKCHWRSRHLRSGSLKDWDFTFIQWSSDSTHVILKKTQENCLCSAVLLFFSFKCNTSEIPSGYQKTLKVQTKNVQKDIFLCLVAPLSLLSPLPSWPLITNQNLLFGSFQLSFKHSAGSSSIARLLQWKAPRLANWKTSDLLTFKYLFHLLKNPKGHLLLCLLLNLSKLFSQIFKFPPVQKPRLLAGGSVDASIRRQIFPTSIPLAS